MKRNTPHYQSKTRIVKIMFPLLFVAVSTIYGQYHLQDVSAVYPAVPDPASVLKTGVSGNSGLIHTTFKAYQAFSDEYASDEDEYNADIYKQQKLKYGVMSGVFGALSVTSIILMSVGEWERTSTPTSVSINAVDGASATGLIMSLVSFPMTIYSLIRLGISSSKSRQYPYGFIPPRVDQVVAYDVSNKRVTTKLILTF